MGIIPDLNITFSELEQISEAVWYEVFLKNIRYKKKVKPHLNDFCWFCWSGMKVTTPEICTEHMQWNANILLTGNYEFSPEDKHLQAITNRIANGWTYGERRNNDTKSDPYLTELIHCPDWFAEWCIIRDNTVKNILKLFYSTERKRKAWL
jgi:hypothetical protein